MRLTDEQAKGFEADGFAKIKPPDNSGLLKMWVKIRPDKMIPDFEGIAGIDYHLSGEESGFKYLGRIVEMATEHMGMFVNEIFKMNERDVLYALGEDLSGDIEVMPSLRCLKKALTDYLERSGQQERLKRVSESILCSCRQVSDFDVREAYKRGMTTFEMIRTATGAGSGCGSCEARVRSVLEE